MEILNFNEFKLLLEADGDIASSAPAPNADPFAAATPAPPVTPTADPFASPELPPDPNAPLPTDEPPAIKLVFLDKDHSWHSQYADGGGVKRFTEYQINNADLDSWITNNNLTSSRDQIYNAIEKAEPLPSTIYDKLKAELSSNKLGKDLGSIDIDYDNQKVPSVNDLNVIFITKQS